MKYFRLRRVSLVLFALLLAGGSAAWRWFSSGPRYNVLLVTLDTTRADHLGCYGCSAAHTPVLDALAEEGVVFESAIATVPLTLPSHASILTGLYPPENGIHLNGVGRLDGHLPNLAESLRSHGYSTAAFIASVVLHAKHGLDHGFDLYDDDMAGGEQHGHESHLMRKANLVVDSALTWLNQHHEDPFFCWVHLFDPHAPYEGAAEVFGDRFRDNPYDGDIAFADLHVGRLVRFLKDKGAWDNTLIVVVGDHGEGLGEHDESEHGFMLYQSTVRVPLIIRCPDHGRPGHRVPQSVSQVDIFPTVLDCLQVDSADTPSGISLRPALGGAPLPDRWCYAESLAVSDAFGWAPLHSVTSAHWKYVQTTRDELYDLRTDADELHNLAESQPQKLRELHDQYVAITDQMSQHVAADAGLNDADRRRLESLGYVAGSSGTPAADAGKPLPDVKDMIVHYNAEIAARQLIGEGNTQEAIERLQQVIEAAPDFLPARMTLGAAYQKQGQPDKAVDVFQAAIDIDSDASLPHFQLGKHFAAEGETAKAMEHYRTAIRLDPQDATSHFNLGSLLFAEGEFEQARVHYEIGLDEFPDSVVGQFNFSVLLSSRGELEPAFRHARRAAELSPLNPQVQFHFGKVCASMGNFRDAVTLFEHTLRIAPDYPQAEELLRHARQQLSAN